MNVTVNNTVSQDTEVRARQTEQGLTLDIVRAAISNDMRRGGNMVAHATEQVYGLTRQGR